MYDPQSSWFHHPHFHTHTRCLTPRTWSWNCVRSPFLSIFVVSLHPSHDLSFDLPASAFLTGLNRARTVFEEPWINCKRAFGSFKGVSSSQETTFRSEPSVESNSPRLKGCAPSNTLRQDAAPNAPAIRVSIGSQTPLSRGRGEQEETEVGA